MKYIGYLLFILIFVCVFFVQSAKVFFIDSFELAPEITVLVSVCYIYIVFLTIILSLFPRLLTDRIAVYDSHIKMTCSVMVSLGLVGTFLGLVDMISGIGAALSGEESDFGKRMAALLGAISTSLGAMSFAFMTSILGVGVSAYSLVAATFVSTSFSEAKRKEERSKEKEIVAEVKKEEEKEDKNAVNEHYTQLVVPILERIDTLEERKIESEKSIPINNVLLERMQKLEDQFLNVDIKKFETEYTPLVVMDSILKHHQLLERHNELLTESILELNRNHLTLVESLDSLSINIDKRAVSTKEQSTILHDLNISLLKNNTLLHKIDNCAEEIKIKSSSVFDKFRKAFD